MNRTLLLLGGSAQQVKAIEIAKALGLKTVLCDYLPDNPGQHLVDVFHLVSTTDLNAVLEIALQEDIDGVVAYSSDPAAPTAAYVSEALSLPGIPFKTARALCEKNRFREFLSKSGFPVPWAETIESAEEGKRLHERELPFIVKPIDSSGSKGVAVIRDMADLDAAIRMALTYSRSKTVIAEEFIEREHSHVIEAEIFIVDGRVVGWGLINSIRDIECNPLVPAGYSYPLDLPEKACETIRIEVQRLVDKAGIRMGAMNLEMVIDGSGALYFLDAGPRNGGNMLPEFIGEIAGTDYVEATIKAALGESLDIAALSLNGTEGGYWGLAVLHSRDAGCLESVTYSPQAEEALFREIRFKEDGEMVRPFFKSDEAIGLSFFKFEEDDAKRRVMDDMAGNIYVNVIQEPSIA